MSTNKISLTPNQYVRINISTNPMLIEAREGEIRVVVTENQPVVGTGAYHRVRDGYPLWLNDVDANVWALSKFSGAKAVVTEIGPKFSSFTQFGEILGAQRTPVIELNSTYGISALRDITIEENGGTIDDINGTVTTGELLLETNTNVDGRAVLESAEVARYIPGYSAQLGIGVRFVSAPTGSQYVRFGGLTSDLQNGFYFGYDATGVYAARTKEGVEVEKVYQSNWNIDKLNGLGDSGHTLNITDGNVYQIDWTWYGYGQILFGVLGVVDGQQFFIPCHSMRPEGETSVADPSLRITVDAENNGTGSNFQTYVGGRQYSIIGKYIPKFRYTAEIRGSTALSTTTKPLISFRIKSGFGNRSVKIANYDVINNGNTRIYIEIRLNGTLTGASFATPTSYNANETALEADNSATAILGGEVIWSGDLVNTGNAGNLGQSSRALDFDVPETGTITLCATAFSGTPAVFSGFRLKEEW